MTPKPKYVGPLIDPFATESAPGDPGRYDKEAEELADWLSRPFDETDPESADDADDEDSDID